MLYTGKAENMDISGSTYQVKTVSGSFEVGDSIRMLHGSLKNIPFAPIRVSRVGIFSRDGWSCVYCGSSTKKTLTVDHVIPVSRGGGNTWSNLVTACSKCNSAKGDKLLEECSIKFNRHVNLRPPIHKFLKFSEEFYNRQNEEK
jgi:hypothetical protein